MKLTNQDIICNWEINNNDHNINQDIELNQYIVLFISDEDGLSTPDQIIKLNKNTTNQGEQEESCVLKIILSKTNKMKIYSIYIESSSKIQEFSINESRDYISTQRSYLLEYGTEKDLYATEYIPPESDIPITNILYIKFCSLSVLNKNMLKLSKIIIDCKPGELIMNQQPPPLINNTTMTEQQQQQQPQPIVRSEQDINDLMSVMSMLNFKSLQQVQTPSPTPTPILQLPHTHPQSVQQSQQLQQSLQNLIEHNIKKSISESENRIIELMEKRFNTLFDRIDNLEKKIENLNK